MRIKHGGKRESILIKKTSVDMCYHVVHRIPERKISMMNISWWTIILLFEFPNKNTNSQLKRILPVLRLWYAVSDTDVTESDQENTPNN